MNKSSRPSRLQIILFITLGITVVYLFVLSTASQGFCQLKTSKEEKACILGFIPIDRTSSIISSMLGAVYTITALYALEKIKLQDTKPEIKIEFLPKFSAQKNEKETKEKYDKEIKNEYIVECKPHQIYVRDSYDTTDNNLNVGEATFVRVKVENTSELTVEGCRVFLQNIKRIDKQDEQVDNNKCFYNDFLPLLWAYELKGDYFVANSGVTIPSGAYVYADVFVAYNKAITPPKVTPRKDKKSTSTTSANKTDENSWYLKLKTKIYNTKYDHLIEIPKNDYCKYIFTLKVCADQCENKDIKLILEHEKEQEYVSICKEKSGKKSQFHLPSNELNNDDIKAINTNRDTLYKLL